MLGWAAFAFAMVGILLMLIGNFTEEWVCRCNGSDHWECKGPNCNSAALAHFDASRHGTSCKRADWPIVVLDRVGSFILGTEPTIQ